MARKRGGIAGFYDRNKNIIKPVAAGLAGAFGTPALGALVGAAIGGLDREGKSGIGFDVGKGIKGGISGYGAGTAGAGLKGMFTGQLAKRAALKGAGKALEATKGVANIAMPGIPEGVGAAASAAPSAASGGFNAAQYMADDFASQVGSKAMQLGKNVVTKTPSFLKSKEGLGFAGNALTAGANIMGNQAASRQAQQVYDDEQNRRQAQAEVMMLFAPQMASNLGMTNFMPQAAGMSGNTAMSTQDYMDSTGANETEEEFGPEMMNYANRGRPASSSQGFANYVNSRQNRR